MDWGSKLSHAGIAVAFAVMVFIARFYSPILQKNRLPPLLLNQLAIFDRFIPTAASVYRRRLGVVF
jgi:hypothetical protein